MTEYLVPDAAFGSDNEYGIPTLNIEKQALFFELPVAGWAAVSRHDRMRGTWHFYTDDYKFTALWHKPDQVLKTKALGTVEVNFSTNDQMPAAEAIYRIYKKRWLARYWQEYNMPIIVDLNVSKRYQALNLYGVPDGWCSYCTWATDSRIDELFEHYRIAHEKSKWNHADLRFMVYGGGPKVKEACMKNSWLHIEDARHAASAAAEANKKS